MRVGVWSALFVLAGNIGMLCYSQAQPAPPSTSASQTVPSSGLVTAAERSNVVNSLAVALQDQYLDPQTGARYATLIRNNVAQGRYDALVEPAAFAEKVTADLQAESPDGHLRLAPEAEFHGQRTRPTDASGSARTIGRPGLEEARMIGDVAFLRFNAFPDDPKVAADARDFLIVHSDAKALIIDVRPNRGGGLDIMTAMLPLLYPQTTTLLRMDTRASAQDIVGQQSGGAFVRQPSPDALVRYDHVVVPDPFETKLQHVPIYYLTSRRTGSAAEHLALAFKRTHRAVLVGETTAGLNHFGVVESFGRFAAFIPVGHTYDPDTGWDWEGKGVTPDVDVPADKALDEALNLARQEGARTN